MAVLDDEQCKTIEQQLKLPNLCRAIALPYMRAPSG